MIKKVFFIICLLFTNHLVNASTSDEKTGVYFQRLDSDTTDSFPLVELFWIGYQEIFFKKFGNLFYNCQDNIQKTSKCYGVQFGVFEGHGDTYLSISGLSPSKKMLQFNSGMLKIEMEQLSVQINEQVNATKSIILIDSEKNKNIKK